MCRTSAQEDLEALSNESARWVLPLRKRAGVRVCSFPDVVVARPGRRWRVCAAKGTQVAPARECLVRLQGMGEPVDTLLSGHSIATPGPPLPRLIPWAPARPHTPRRLANRLRSLLPADQRATLEAALASLAPLLDLRAPHPADSPAEGQGPEAPPALAAGHAVIEELAQQGCQRAEALAQAAADGAAQLVAAPAAEDAAAAGGQPAAQEGSEGGGEDQPATVPAGGEAQPAAPALKALAGLHADGVRSVAELCSLCLERLLALGRSVSYFYRSGRPANDGEPAGP